QGGQQDGCRNRRGAEGGDQRVLRGDREPTAALVGGERPCDRGVGREAQAEDERGAAQFRHGRAQAFPTRSSSSAGTSTGTWSASSRGRRRRRRSRGDR